MRSCLSGLLKIEHAGSSGDEHVFDPKCEGEAEVDEKENAGSGKGGIDEENAQFWNWDSQFGAHSGKDAEPLPLYFMP